MRFFLPVGTLWWREIVRFYRQRSRLLGALATPLLFWLLIGSGIGASFRPPGTHGSIDYLEYFYPGTVLLVILFTAIFSTISIIEDRRQGFLLSVLVAPVPRSSLVLGSVLGGATLAFLQGFVLILLAPLLGLHLGLEQVLWLAGALFLISVGLTALGFSFAWKMDSTQGFHAIMNLLLFPLWLLSGALFPPSGASRWIRWVMVANPLTYGLALVRRSLYDSPAAGPLPSFSASLLVVLLFGTGALATAFLLARRTDPNRLG